MTLQGRQQESGAPVYMAALLKFKFCIYNTKKVVSFHNTFQTGT